MKKSSVLTVGALCVAGLIGATELRANGGAISALVAPKTAVAIVNLEKLMELLDETKQLNDELKVMFDKRSKEFEEVRARAKALEEDVKLLPEGTKERRLKAAEEAEAKSLVEARYQIYQKLIEIDRGELVRQMYTKITASVEAFSKKEGYELVLLDDRGITLPNSGTANTMNTAIQAKRIIFAADGLDITDRIATLMNTEYKAPAKRK